MPEKMKMNAASASQGAEKTGMTRRNIATNENRIGVDSQTRYGLSRCGSWMRNTSTHITVHPYQNQEQTPAKLTRLVKPEPNTTKSSVRVCVSICAYSGVPNFVCSTPICLGRYPSRPAAAARCEYVYIWPLSAPKHENATSAANTMPPVEPNVAMPKSNATEFVRATRPGGRTRKYETTVLRNNSITTSVLAMTASDTLRAGSSNSPVTNVHWSHPSKAQRPLYSASAYCATSFVVPSKRPVKEENACFDSVGTFPISTSTRAKIGMQHSRRILTAVTVSCTRGPTIG